MNEKLTHERFHELLNTYMGAMEHAIWCNKNCPADVYQNARDAAASALNALEKAVFP
jgi:hypothetical protein